MINTKDLKNEKTLYNLNKRGYHLNENIFLFIKEKKDINIQIEDINKKINNNTHTHDDKNNLKKTKR